MFVLRILYGSVVQVHIAELTITIILALTISCRERFITIKEQTSNT